MRVGVILRYVGIVQAGIGAFVLIAALVGLLYADGSAGGLAWSGVIIIAVGLLPLLPNFSLTEARPRESLAIVVGAWLTTGLTGALPYLLYGAPFSLMDALFESVSGFTTTGASILTDIESLPKGLLFWRAETHLLGGVGIIVLALAIFPLIGRVSHTLLKQEYTEVTAPPRLPRTRDIARIVASIYFGLIGLQTAALLLAGLPLFDAAATAFGTIATGGFSVQNESIAGYGSLAVELIVMAFMLISGVNFAFLFNLMRRSRGRKEGWTVLKTYLLLQFGAIVIVVFSVRGEVYAGWWESLRHAAFETISQGTSTGFATADTSVWPESAQLVLMFVTLICACAGSTSGGIKIDRLVLFLKTTRQRLLGSIHPNVVSVIRLDGKTYDMNVGNEATLFIVLYLTVIAASSLILTLAGVGAVEAISGSIACIGGVGPGLGAVGSMGNYGGLPPLAKADLIVVMLAGRLELFALILPFTRAFWKK